ncbi:MAG: hypothetical protein ACRDIB_12130, partial [Ardenticatenaceae bacterium]
MKQPATYSVLIRCSLVRIVRIVLALASVIALALSGRSASPAHAATFQVDDDGVQCPSALYTTIQAAIDAAAPGDTIEVCAGTYNENVSINKVLTLEGAGSDADPATNTIISGSGSGIGLSVVDGTDATTRVLVQDVRVTGFLHGLEVGSFTTLANVASTGNADRGLELRPLQDLLIQNSRFNGNAIGLRVATTADVDNVEITGSQFNDNSLHGWFIAKSSNAGDTSDVSNVTVSNTTFNNNLQKGLYAEKLSDALFDNITVDNSGTDPTYGFNNGIDINLKYQPYQNITIQNASITNSGAYGTAPSNLFPAAVTIKARDDAPSYNSDPATLDGVTLTNVTIGGPENALRFGEAGKSNVGPTNVVVFHSSLLAGNSHGDTGFGLIDETQAQPIAEENWWSTAVPDFVALASGDADTDPWCINVACTTTVSANPDGSIVVPPDATTSDIQQLLDDAPPGTVFHLPGGSFQGGLTVSSEGITLNLNGTTFGPGSPAFTINAADVTIQGPGTLDGDPTNSGTNSGSPAILVTGGGDNFTLRDVEVKRWADGVQ